MSDEPAYLLYESIMKGVDEAVTKRASASEVISAMTAVLAEIIRAAPMDQRNAFRAVIYDDLSEQLGRVWRGLRPRVPGATDVDDRDLYLSGRNERRRSE
jgi:hypothetical protein